MTAHLQRQGVRLSQTQACTCVCAACRGNATFASTRVRRAATTAAALALAWCGVAVVLAFEPWLPPASAASSPAVDANKPTAAPFVSRNSSSSSSSSSSTGNNSSSNGSSSSSSSRSSSSNSSSKGSNSSSRSSSAGASAGGAGVDTGVVQPALTLVHNDSLLLLLQQQQPPQQVPSDSPSMSPSGGLGLGFSANSSLLTVLRLNPYPATVREDEAGPANGHRLPPRHPSSSTTAAALCPSLTTCPDLSPCSGHAAQAQAPSLLLTAPAEGGEGERGRTAVAACAVDDVAWEPPVAVRPIPPRCNVDADLLAPLVPCRANVSGAAGDVLLPGCAWAGDRRRERRLRRRAGGHSGANGAARGSVGSGVGAQGGSAGAAAVSEVEADAAAAEEEVDDGSREWCKPHLLRRVLNRTLAVWREGWAPQVAVLRNVYVNHLGQVFNATHLFDVGGCHAQDEFSYAEGVRVRRVAAAVNLLDHRGGVRHETDDAADMDDTLALGAMGGYLQRHGHARARGQEQHRQRLNWAVDGVTYEVALALLAMPLVDRWPALHGAVWMVDERCAVPRGLAAHLLSQLQLRRSLHSQQQPPPPQQQQQQLDMLRKQWSDRLREAKAPGPKEVWHVDILLQPLFQSCEQPSTALWRAMRSSAPWAQCTAADMDTSPYPPLSPPGAPRLPPDWVAVVDTHALAALGSTGTEQLDGLLRRFVARQRIVVLGDELMGDMAGVQDLFSHAALFVTLPGPYLTNLVFMPPNASIVLLHAQVHAHMATSPHHVVGDATCQQDDGGKPLSLPSHAATRRRRLLSDSPSAVVPAASPPSSDDVAVAPRLAEMELAEACGVRMAVVFCCASGSHSSGSSSSQPTQQEAQQQALVCSKAALREVLDRVALDLYTATGWWQGEEGPWKEEDADIAERYENYTSVAEGTAVVPTLPNPSCAFLQPRVAAERVANASADTGMVLRASNSASVKASRALAAGATHAAAAAAATAQWRAVARSKEFLAWQQCVVREGAWVLDPTPRRLPWLMEFHSWWSLCDSMHVALDGGVAFADADAAAERWAQLVAAEGGQTKTPSTAVAAAANAWNVRPGIKYEWEVADTLPPAKCPRIPVSDKDKAARVGKVLERLDGREFCRRVGRNRTIVFMGDSLQEQMMTSLLGTLVAHLPKPVKWELQDVVDEEWRAPLHPLSDDNIKFLLRDVHVNHSVCPGMRVVFLRNYHLWGPTGRGLPWTWQRVIASADVFVVNRGAHFARTPVFARDLRALYRYIRLRFPDKPVIFRNTPPGHSTCVGARLPTKEPEDPGKLPVLYNWASFYEQNEVARQITLAAGYVYLDVTTMTALRPDGHFSMYNNLTATKKPDCLHYCVPGPIDTWNRLLYNVLLWLMPLPDY